MRGSQTAENKNESACHREQEKQSQLADMGVCMSTHTREDEGKGDLLQHTAPAEGRCFGSQVMTDNRILQKRQNRTQLSRFPISFINLPYITSNRSISAGADTRTAERMNALPTAV